ncbi:MAG: cytosolic protein [Acidobacteria bacterium]|nr:cytosolic protein [Acidobacteriota bacterium]
MNRINLDAVQHYVNQSIGDFHKARIRALENSALQRLLKKNPYLFKAKNLITAGDLITSLMEASLSSSEEELFGDFLEDLAVFVAQQTSGGHKSTAPGVDLEFFNHDIHYVVSVKSGPNWGNSSQQSKLEQDLKNAVVRVKQSKRGGNVQPVLGICYGKTRTSYLRGYLKIVGQNFWYLISENKDLYTEIIEPIGYQAREHNDAFLLEKAKVINRFTKLFLETYCDETGAINWARLVEVTCGNYDLDKFLP